MKLFKSARASCNIGAQMESAAARYLCAAGLTIEARNFHCSMGEIDLIARDGETLVFVEVRYRRSDRFGGAKASVDRKKQQKLLAAANYYLQRKALDCPCRFDVIAIQGENAADAATIANAANIQWITDAFQVEI